MSSARSFSTCSPAASRTAVAHAVQLQQLSYMQRCALPAAQAAKMCPPSSTVLRYYLTHIASNPKAYADAPPTLTADPLFRLYAVTLRSETLAYMDEAHRTEPICMVAVQTNGWLLGLVPPAVRTLQVRLAAVAQNGMAIVTLPEEECTEEVCTAAVAQDGLALECVPPHAHTEAVCLAAVMQNAYALEQVLPHMRTARVCHAAVVRECSMLQCVPEAVLTEDLCLEALQHDSAALAYVPPHLRTRRVLTAAAHFVAITTCYVPRKGGACAQYEDPQTKGVL